MGYQDIKRSNPDKETHVISIINQKGGVGKSTTAINLSAALGDLGYKVLVVDFDPQGNTSSGYGIEKEILTLSVYNALFEETDMGELIQGTPVDRVYVVPATIQLAGAEVELVNAMSRETRLKDMVQIIKDEFDYVFIDCPPSLGLLTINALVASNSLLIPIQCEYYALEGVTKLLESMQMVKQRLNQGLDIFGVLLTMFDSRTILSKEVAEEVRRFFKEKVFETIIPRSVKVSEAPSYGLPVTEYANNNSGAIAYRDLAEEVISRG